MGWQPTVAWRALEENLSISVRDLITRSNAIARDMGFNQAGEVVCRKYFLDHPYSRLGRQVSLPASIPGEVAGVKASSRNTPGRRFREYSKPIAVMHFDMCRTRGNPQDYVIDNDEFSPR